MKAKSAWIWLLLAGGFEVAFTTCMALDGLVANALFVVAAGFSFYCMTRAMRTLPIGTVYAVWTAIGAAGTVLVGILAFGDAVTFWRLFFVGVIIAVIIALKRVSPPAVPGGS